MVLDEAKTPKKVLEFGREIAGVLPIIYADYIECILVEHNIVKCHIPMNKDVLGLDGILRLPSSAIGTYQTALSMAGELHPHLATLKVPLP